ncbi:MAG TPA: HNH endonuclease, partial [Dermatophilaceae bacterium]|nr:HNH endonuclease [Dermatophilaceae bacterium]
MSPAPTRDEIREFIARLALLDGCAEVDSERLELVTLLDSAKASLAAAQVRVTVAFDASQRAAQRAAGVPVDKLGAGIAEQVALARRDSPTRGSQHLGLAKALVHEMPGTLAALTAGELSEWRATLIVQATAVLDPDMRRVADARLAGRLGTLSDKQVRAAAMAVAYELDPRSFVDRAAYAVSQRRVSIRPAPDTMA